MVLRPWQTKVRIALISHPFPSPHASPPPKWGGSWCYGECRQKCQWRFFFCLPHTQAPPPRGGGHGATESADKNASGINFSLRSHIQAPPMWGGPVATANAKAK